MEFGEFGRLRGGGFEGIVLWEIGEWIGLER
jgi:hypothetical protein